MLRHRSAIPWLLTLSLACQPVPGTSGAGETTSSPDAPFVASAPGGDALVFPPPPELSSRRTLPRHMAEDEHTGEAATEVEWPQLDDEGRFEIAGRAVRIDFNRSVVPPAEGVPALSIDPAVDGEISWPNPWTVVFRAAQTFDPEAEYTVALGEIYDEGGQRVSEGWTGTFTAEPRVSIAGKVIAYLPEAGKPRMVAVRPDAPPRVDPAIAPRVLFDQPVTLAQASARLRAQVDGAPRRLILSHPGEDAFEGVGVDREHVVVARPSKPLGPGQTLSLEVLDEAGATAAKHEYEAARPLAFERVECNDYYYEERECTWKSGTLTMDGDRFALRFNNPIPDTKDLARRVRVSPKVDDLRVHSDTWRSDGSVWISGSFDPSTRYTVKVGRLEDRYGSRLGGPLRLAVETLPLSASVSMPEGQQVLDQGGSTSFPVTTRNVEEARIDLWEVEPRAEAWAEARRRLGNRERPSGAADLSIAVRPRAKRDASVTTEVDLLDHLEAGKTYVARLELVTTAFGAVPPKYPTWAMASRPATALVTPHDDRALAVHVHAGRDQTLVHVAGLGDGHPIEGARLLVDGERVPGVRTDADGMAVLARSLGGGHVVEVESPHGRAVLAMSNSTLDEHDLAPELAGGREVLDDIRALVLSDRGVYRPGATVELKGIVSFRHDGALRPASTMPVGLRIHAPTGKQVLATDGITNDMGSMVGRFEVPANAEIGRYRVDVVATLRDDAVLASTVVQVAEFEPPRFTVDVEAERAAQSDQLQASVHGRYLFGAAMEDAPVAWTLRRSDAPLPRGPLTAKGFVFRRVRSWWDDDDAEAWVRSGEGSLDAAGRLALSPRVELASDRGPQRFALEAEVTDESHRSISGRASVVLHPAQRYAGLKLGDRWLDVGKAIPVEAGVVDTEGHTVSSTPVELRLERIEWKRARRPGPGGGADEDWHEVIEEVGRCTTSGSGTAGCTLVPRSSGSYRISAWVDGRRGGAQRVWAWRYGSGSSPMPSPGRRLELVADRSSYRPGDTATLMVSNPYPSATAILTVEQGGILHHETRTITEAAARFSIELGREHAPHAHATVTLLPRDAEGQARVDWKLGAIRLPVELEDQRLDVTVASDRDRYGPGEAVDIVVDVSHAGTAVEGAEVALAVVDEGVLRLTNFHAPDPVPALYPGQGLELSVDDSRRLLAEQLSRSHVAGDGSGAGSHSLVSTRKDFVRTALWKPQLRTDADGRAHVRFTLPDNLTRFRMMAVVLDDQGRGGVHEDDFEVQMPLMAIPAVPRFATVGDRFEAAVLVHNNQDHAETTTVTMGKRNKEVEIEAGGRARVAFDIAPKEAGSMTLTFAVADAKGEVRDRVEATLPVQAPGIDERPYLHGSFTGRQLVSLEIPDDVVTGPSHDEYVTVTVGENLWPELGARVEYLVGYPHGCVEQTTSSTIPLLAARDILPRLGLTRFSDEQLRTMIGAGVERLSTMRTSEGGLAYWPGGHEANPFGTAYATLAIARAQRLGIEAPEGMVDDMREYMVHMLELDTLPHGYGVEVKAMLALALAELSALPPERADALWDTRAEQGVFGKATLALALSTLPGQEARVATLLDELEGSFDEEGRLLGERGEDFQYYGSDQRSIAQSAIALHRLRPGSAVLARLTTVLIQSTGGYTTHGTAYGLLALAERIRDADGEVHRQRARLAGVELTPDLSDALVLGPSARRYRIPLSEIRGRRVELELESESPRAQTFMVSARWRRPAAATGSRAATTTETGPDLYRVITDAKGHAVDFDAIEPGQVLRVVLLSRLPADLPYSRRGYLAVTDRLPAGFEALQPDLWTVASVPELDDEHPLYDQLRWSGSPASHVELRDDRAHFYFDRVWGEWVHATYLMRATTPGTFAAPPAVAELMYEPDSAGYSEGRSFTVTQ